MASYESYRPADEPGAMPAAQYEAYGIAHAPPREPSSSQQRDLERPMVSKDERDDDDDALTSRCARGAAAAVACEARAWKYRGKARARRHTKRANHRSHHCLAPR
jgi:hypothetical protein